MSDMERARAFWDDVFENNKTEWVADHSAQYFCNIFDLLGRHVGRRAGGFSALFERSVRVLDVGPGHGRLLERHGQLPPPRVQYAIEISEINRAALQDRNIIATAPGTDAFDGVGIDLAWSVSCLPHCTIEMQAILARQVYHALKPGGLFFVEHVVDKEGYLPAEEEIRLPAGRYTSDLFDFARHAAWSRWDFKYRDVGGPECPVQGWIARFEK